MVMIRSFPALMIVTSLFAGGDAAAAAPKVARPPVKLVAKPAERRVDVLIGDQPFTSCMYPEGVAKPILFPLRSASGTIVTRGYPLDPRPGEAQDHPHHTGLWFNYGEVNAGDMDNVNFWGNSEQQRKGDAKGK